jgi:hypothetical protein
MANENVRTTPTRTVDPNVRLPEAVVRAAVRAAELSEQQRTNTQDRNNSNTSNANTMTFVDVNSSTPPIPERRVNPLVAQPQNSLSGSSPQQRNSQPQRPPNGSSSASADERSNNNQDKHYSESEFRAMVGRFEKSQQENKNLVSRVNEMQRLLATIQPPPNSQVGRGDVTFNTPVAPRRYITPQDEKEWSVELIDMARRAAREVAEEQLAPVRGEIGAVRQSLGSVQQHVTLDAQGQVYQALEREFGPDWDAEKNNDPGFIQWLGQIDPMTGLQRKNILKHAFDNGEASRVVATFKRYEAELAASGPVQTGRSPQGNGAESSEGSTQFASVAYSRGNPATTPAVDLTTLAAPGRARPGQTQTPPDKPIITGAEIAEFYSDVTKGRYKGHEDIQAQVEAQIQEASREGRIRR